MHFEVAADNVFIALWRETIMVLLLCSNGCVGVVRVSLISDSDYIYSNSTLSLRGA